MRPGQLPLSKMTVAGMMSGTSADGIDVAFTRIQPSSGDPDIPELKLLGHCGFPFPPTLRRAVLEAMNAANISTAELARLNWRLGQAYAEAFAAARERMGRRVDLVGCHGQTIYHQPAAQRYLGREASCTWQIGEMALLAEESGTPVVSDFRPADMVAGGQGAPLVPLLDYVFFRHPTRGRVLQNLGGIGNLTALPPGASAAQVVAFDTGPGNMVIDQLMQRQFHKPFDRGGRTAAAGAVIEQVVRAELAHPFFAAPPPKSAGREQFGREYATHFQQACGNAAGTAQDAIATAAALTARSVALGYSRFVARRMKTAPVDFIVSGGGARNLTLMRMLAAELEPLGCKVQTSDEAGLPAEAKEAAAFALLAYQTWHRRPGNIPSATGAERPMILGQIAYV